MTFCLLTPVLDVEVWRDAESVRERFGKVVLSAFKSDSVVPGLAELTREGDCERS